MSEQTSKILIAAAALMAVTTGCRCTNPPEASTPSLKNRTKLQALEDRILSASGETETDFDALIHEIQVVSKKLVWLESTGSTHDAVDVYLCTELEKEHVCRFIYADDTIHTTEFPERYAPVVIDSEETLKVGCQGSCPSNLRFHLGDPSEMHSSGYGDLLAIPLSDAGVLTLDDVPANKQLVLFTIVKQPGDGLYRKYVWVIEKR